MYSMVLMVAMVPAGDVAGFGKKGGCTGETSSCSGGFLGHKHKQSSGCSGTVVSYGCTGYTVPTYGCTGSVAPAGCTGVAMPAPTYGCTGSVAPTYGCTGYSVPSYGCTGTGHTTGCSGCHGSGHGFLGLKKKHSSGCSGTVVSYGCTGYTPTTSYGCTGYTPTTSGCVGTIVTAPPVMTVPPAPMPAPDKK